MRIPRCCSLTHFHGRCVLGCVSTGGRRGVQWGDGAGRAHGSRGTWSFREMNHDRRRSRRRRRIARSLYAVTTSSRMRTFATGSRVVSSCGCSGTSSRTRVRRCCCFPSDAPFALPSAARRVGHDAPTHDSLTRSLAHSLARSASIRSFVQCWCLRRLPFMPSRERRRLPFWSS